MHENPRCFNPEALLALVGNDYTQLKEILDLFIDTFDDTPARVRAAQEQGDTAETERLLHQLKGTVASIWPGELYEQTSLLEMQANSGLALSETLLEQWHVCFDSSFQAIHTFMAIHCNQPRS